MAQRLVHQVAQVLAPDCAPLFLTDGFREYLTALLTHYGHWVQPPRRQATGPAPKPRWMPLPQLLYAQVVKTVRRRRLVRVQPPRGVRHPGGRRAGAGGLWLADQHGLCRAAQPRPSGSVWRQSGGGSPRCARARTACGSNWCCSTPITIFACRMRACAVPLAAAGPDQRHGLRQAVAAVDAGHGGGADRPCLDAA